jgi:hypothetical protein
MTNRIPPLFPARFLTLFLDLILSVPVAAQAVAELGFMLRSSSFLKTLSNWLTIWYSTGGDVAMHQGNGWDQPKSELRARNHGLRDDMAAKARRVISSCSGYSRVGSNLGGVPQA